MWFPNTVRFSGSSLGANDIAAINIDHHVAIEILALGGANQLGDVPAAHLAGSGDVSAAMRSCP